MSEARPKIVDVLGEVRGRLQKGRVHLLPHALARMRERRVILPEIRFVLGHGYHEKQRDEYKKEYGCWNYAIRGSTVDGRQLRLAISLERVSDIDVITVIVLGA